MKKKFAILVFLVLIGTVNAQTDRWNIGIAYQSSPVVHSYDYVFPGYTIDYNLNRLTLDFNYCFSKFEVGGFLGYGIAKMDISTTEKDIIYGANVKLQILPFILNSEKMRLKLYALGKTGIARSSFMPNSSLKAVENLFIGSAFLGSSYYFTKHMGIFLEGGYEKFHQGNFNVRYGLTLKF